MTQPDEIRLISAPNHIWTNPGALESHENAMRELGFLNAGTYAVDVLPVAIRFLIHKSGEMYGTIYEHAKVGVWINFVVLYESGPSITFTNTQDRGLEQRPGHPVVHAANAAAEQLFAIAEQQTPPGKRKTVSASSIVDEFQRAWAEGIRWRKEKGFSKSEIASVLMSRGGKDARYLRPDRIQFVVEQDGPPERELKKRFVTVFQQHLSVHKAYLVYVMYDEAPSGNVALCLTSASPEDAELVAAINKIFASVFQKGTHLDIMFVPKPDLPRLEAVCRPFYTRTSQ